LALKQTPLHDRHIELGAKMVEFGGWHMPIQYKSGIIKEHHAVRQAVGLFDVSHMGEVAIRGRGALGVVQRLMTNDAAALEPGKAMYTVMCLPSGGIVDDCIVYERGPEDYLVVVNASNIDKDREWMKEAARKEADVVDESDKTALIAVQGPKARELVARLAGQSVLDIGRFRFATLKVGSTPATVARTGYTGEDGFEIACASDAAVALWDALLDAGKDLGVAPIGLGARDTLRLEARLSLYGNDIDETTTPYEADLGWVVKLDAKDFIGKEVLAAEKRAGSKRKLIGFRIAGKGIARHDYPILDENRKQIGRVTSGTTSITTGGAIGLGYVPAAAAKPGSDITIDCRGKDVTAQIVAGPFYKRGSQ
jgi:aminomethyltransferase